MKNVAIVLAVAGIGAALGANNPNLCKFTPQHFASDQLSYDVTSAIPASQDFVWEDSRSMDARNFTFQFNLCQNTFGKPSSACPANRAAAAWQLDRNTDSCYALSGDLSKTPAPLSKTLHDPTKPALGFDLRYYNGDSDFCQENGATFSRSFKLTFLCDASLPVPTPGAQPQEEFIREISPCVYEAYSFSPLGCPTQCPQYDGKVCGGNGVCRYDSDAVSARCFCNDGYISENGCKPVVVPNPAGGIAGAFFGGLALGGLGVAAWWFLTQRNKAPASGDDYAYAGGLQ